MPDPDPFDLDAFQGLLNRASLARRLSLSTSDKQAAVTLEQLAKELDGQIDLLTKEILRG